MSKLGYIYSSYGKNFNICISNTYGVNVLNGSNLPSNSIIICSPIDEKGNDLGIYSIVATDFEGTPVRLTYSLQQGNGLSFKDDSIKLNIDGKTIIEEGGVLKVNLDNIIDNDTLKFKDSVLSIDIDSLKKSSSEDLGVFSVDGKSLVISDGVLTVNTQNLEYANSDSKQYGIAIGDGKTIYSDQGVLKLNTQNFDLATNDEFGMIMINDSTIDVNEGVLSVNTENIQRGDSEIFGIVKPNNNEIILHTN